MVEAATTMLGDAEALQAWREGGERADVRQVRADAEARVPAAEAQRVTATRAAEAAENKTRDAEAEAAAAAMEAMQDEIDDLADQLAVSQRRTEETAWEHSDQLDRSLVERAAALDDRDRLPAAELAAAHRQATAVRDRGAV